MQSIILGGGCFWCLDAVYRQVRGIEKSVSGYAGGHVERPTYEQVSTGATGHAEVVRLNFDEVLIDLKTILDIFWIIHDPTTLDRQGNDVGSQYRSIILYRDEEQRVIAQHSREHAQKLWPDPIVTEIKQLEEFYPAEEYHQNYFANHPEEAYCQVVINPKLHKLQQKFQSLLR